MPLINVERPVTHSSWDQGKYTTYDIRIDCRDDSCPLFTLPLSCVSRRYSEFKWLRRRLQSICFSIDVPQLPSAGCFWIDRFTQEFIESRRLGLECFVQKIYSIPTLLSEAAFHLFVQTDLSPAEIDAYISGEWGKRKEVTNVIHDLYQRKIDEERDEISSIASCSRWSDASAFSYLQDLDDESPGASSSCLNNNDDERSAQNGDLLFVNNSALSPITGLYVPSTVASASVDFLSPHSLDPSAIGHGANSMRRRMTEMNMNAANSASGRSSPLSRPLPVPPNVRRVKICSNALMYSSSFDERRVLHNAGGNTAGIENSLRRISDNN